MFFYSDNTAPAMPAVLEAIAEANRGPARAYGDDEWSRRLDEAFARYFEHPVRVFAVATGTAANALALATVTPPYGRCSHWPCNVVQRCGAVDCRVAAPATRLPSAAGLLDADVLEGLADNAISYTACSRAVPIRGSSVAGLPLVDGRSGRRFRRHGIVRAHDGARFANAGEPREDAGRLTWRRV